MGINAEVDRLKRKLVQDINESNLPVCCIDYVVTEIANMVKADYIAAVQEENRISEKMNDPVKELREQRVYKDARRDLKVEEVS